jgi:hypothetical protein
VPFRARPFFVGTVKSLPPAPATPRVGSRVLVSMRPQPRSEDFHRFHSFGRDHFGSGFSIGFGLSHGRQDFFFFGGNPFLRPGCFFNGFTTVCSFQRPFFPRVRLCTFGFAPYGFWPYGYYSASSYDAYAVAQPAEEPVYPPPPDDPGTWLPPEPAGQQPGEQMEPAPAAPLTLLVLRDGSIYGVTDYWLEGGRLHYVTSYGADNSIPIEQLDLQRTVDENWQRGIAFSLRPQP